jgi:hypothetical protein
MRAVFLLVIGLLVGGSLAAQDTVVTTILPKPRKQVDLIGPSEIEEVKSQARDAYEVIIRLRPQFLKNRSRADNIGQADWTRGPGVVLDGSPYGTAEHLRNIEVDAIVEIRYLKGYDAVIRYGADFHAGAILVVTRH